MLFNHLVFLDPKSKVLEAVRKSIDYVELGARVANYFYLRYPYA